MIRVYYNMGPQYIRPEFFTSKYHCQHLLLRGGVVLLCLIEFFASIVYDLEYLFSCLASHIISNSLFQSGVNVMGADTNLDLISLNADLHDSSK